MHHRTEFNPRRNIATITERRREKLRRVIEHRQPDLTVVLENIWDPHNVSAILRSADATGVLDVHLLYYIEKLPDLRRSGKLSSASANKWMRFTTHRDVAECVSALHDQGYRVLASHLTRDAVSLHELDLTQKSAIVVGNENRGVSDAMCELADGVYSIPMVGMVQSLNVSVATAVSLYEALRQRMRAGMYPHPEATAQRVDELLLEWSQR